MRCFGFLFLSIITLFRLFINAQNIALFLSNLLYIARDMSCPIVKLKAGKEVPILGGHPWVFSHGAEETQEQLKSGELVEVLAKNGRFLGMGLVGAGSSIKVRMISMEKLEKIDKDFFVKRFLALDESKKRHLPDGTNAYRIVYADADYLPGLIVDIYGDVLVFQIHTAGMDKLHTEIVEALKEAFKPRAIVERSDVEARRKEGIRVLAPELKYGELAEDGLVLFQEGGIKFYADVMTGQKTGFFLDQRDARGRVRELAGGKRVLNLFSYTGAFSLYAAMGGAESVVSVDVSGAATKMAEKNLELNKNEFSQTGEQESDSKFSFVTSDVFAYLKTVEKGQFDLIICDPPAFTKGVAKIEQAKKAYSDVNQRCLELLEEGGILVTSSCSGRLVMEDFRNILKIAAGKAGKNVKVLAALGQAFDHTDKLAFPEGRYLKTLVLEVT